MSEEKNDQEAPLFEVDPLTENKLTVSQQPTDDEQMVKLQEVDGARTGDFDPTTGAAHPTADSGADRGVKSDPSQRQSSRASKAENG